MNIFQVVLKGDNSTQLVQDDQVKGPLRVCILHAFFFLITSLIRKIESFDGVYLGT